MQQGIIVFQLYEVNAFSIFGLCLAFFTFQLPQVPPCIGLEGYGQACPRLLNMARLEQYTSDGDSIMYPIA
jgi:hypothetical protein